ncbi:hypothetical protein U4E84_08545 [Halorubrum sp. AD140]|uniref:hypothetical protein n=1 Tax=Halorubrum sp. AD140 TaxID=3050073 RepID=UPI002ACC951D|nr:hypothetical protein [Halorubrum sp. AD140]MDZ5811393.1 hypothetical protein [Halorubrum sp. AD140]
MTLKNYESGEEVSENWDTVFKSLSAEPRRQLIVSLLDAGADQSVPLPESAAMPNLPLDPEELRVELYHIHLPMLAENDFITWETDPLVASRGPRFDELAVVFEALHSDAANIPDSLVIGCQRLEQERQGSAART